MDAKEILKEMCRIYDVMAEEQELDWEEHQKCGTVQEEGYLIDHDHYLEGYQAALYDLKNLLGIEEG